MKAKEDAHVRAHERKAVVGRRFSQSFHMRNSDHGERKMISISGRFICFHSSPVTKYVIHSLQSAPPYIDYIHEELLSHLTTK